MKIKVLIITLMAIAIAGAGCAAKGKKEKPQSNVNVMIDGKMTTALGDSLSRIINNSNKVDITSLSLSADSSYMLPQSKRIGVKNLELIKFIVRNPKNYTSNSMVYGVFVPQFEVTFKYKKSKVTLKYDFGLRKWGVFDSEGKEIGMYDLNSENMLRFAGEEFPDNAFYRDLLSTRE